MTVYIVGVLFSAILGFLYESYRKVKNRTIKIETTRNKAIVPKFDLFQLIPMIPLALIAGFRYGVGQDYFYTYVPIFNKVLGGQAEQAWGDAGYTLLNIFVTFFTDDYAGIFLLTSCLFIYFVFKSIYDSSENISLSIILLVFMGYYFCFMNGVRQMLSASILLFSIKYVKKRNFIKFLICVLCASSIHLSALIFLPVYYIYKMKWSNKKITIIVVCSFLLSGPLSKVLLDFMSVTKYGWYLDSLYVAERGGIITIIINIVILAFAMIFNTNKNNEIYLKLQCLTVIMTAFIGKVPIAHRLPWNFGLVGVILVPNIIKSQKDKNMQVMLTGMIVILYFIYFYYTVGVKNSNSVLPYQSIFSR